MKYRVLVNGREHIVSLLSRDRDSVSFEIGGERYSVSVSLLTKKSGAFEESRPPTGTSSAQAAQLTSRPNEITAPIAGTVSSILCTVGEKIEPGQVVAVLEAMKMENNITAPSGAVVKEIHVSTGEQVKNHQLLISLSPLKE